VPLATYPFERQRYWIEDAAPAKHTPKRKVASGHPLLGERIDVAGGPHLWQTEISLEEHPWIGGHVVEDGVVLPATAYVEMAVSAALQVLGDGPIRVSNAVFQKPMFFSGGSEFHVQTRFSIKSSSSGHIEFYSRTHSGEWMLHTAADVEKAPVRVQVSRPAPPEGAREIDGAAFYAHFSTLGNQWGEAFQGVQRAWITEREGWAQVLPPDCIRAQLRDYTVHPALADASGHIMAAIKAFAPASHTPRALVGQSIGEVTVYGKPEGTELFAHASVNPGANTSELLGDVEVYDKAGNLLSALRGAVLRYLDVENESSPAPFDDWFYQVGWHAFDPTPPASAESVVTYLLVGRNAVDPIATQLHSTGAACVVYPCVEALDPALIPPTPLRVIYLGGLDAGPADTRCYELVQMVGKLRTRPNARLYVVTRGAQQKSVWQAPLWGLGRTFAVEHGDLWGGLVDLDADSDDLSNARALYAYLQSGSPEDEVCIRDGSLFTAHLERIKAPSASTLNLSPGAAYIVTGGFSGLGLEVAKWMVTNGARHLILVGRSALPPRTEWQGSEMTNVRAVLELEAAGANVYPACLDVADATSVQEFFCRYRAEARPRVRGVVHAAGALSHNSAASISAGELETVLRPKAGALTLAHALESHELDFFVLFSSASAIIGSPRLGAYAAANALLDTFARTLPCKTVSINWGVWTEAGMATRFDASDVGELAQRGMGGMSTAEGLDALARTLTADLPNVAVLPVNWGRWARLYPAYTQSPLFARILKPKPQTSETQGGAVAGILNAPDPESALETWLRTAVAAVSGFAVENVDPSQPVTDFGLDSLMALELKNRIHSGLRTAIPIVHFLEGRTVVQLAAEILPRLAAPSISESELLERVDEMSEAELDTQLARLLAAGAEHG
jgi:acyl transferase domain-containing protein